MSERKALVWSETPDPEPTADEVLLQVAAAGVNRADCAQRDGWYPPPPGESPILGLEAAGTIVQVGANVRGWQVGDRATALLAGGGYAERVAVPAGQLLPIPAGLDLVQAAALPEVYATAWLNLVTLGELDGPPQRVLIHAGASGVGTAAVQLAVALGHRVWVSVGSDAKVTRCRELGADGGTVRTRDDLAADVQAWAGGVDVILDPVGAASLSANQRVLATDGRLIVIGLLGGRSAPLDLGRLLMKRQRLLGSTLRSRPRAFKAALCAELRRRAWPLVEAGALKPLVDATFAMRDAGDALALLERNQVVGKLILTVEPTSAA